MGFFSRIKDFIYNSVNHKTDEKDIEKTINEVDKMLLSTELLNETPSLCFVVDLIKAPILETKAEINSETLITFNPPTFTDIEPYPMTIVEYYPLIEISYSSYYPFDNQAYNDNQTDKQTDNQAYNIISLD